MVNVPGVALIYCDILFTKTDTNDTPVPETVLTLDPPLFPYSRNCGIDESTYNPNPSVELYDATLLGLPVIAG